MFGLYIHIPFCDKKCDYCSFHVLETATMQDTKWLIEAYVHALLWEITQRATLLPQQSLSTIYFGGGTPSKIGASNFVRIIDHIASLFDLEDIAELSIECNPNPFDDVLSLVETLSTRYKHFPRVRFSFGLQSFDDVVLQDSGRQYTFNQLVGFLRQLQPIKQSHNIFNFDFIAFGRLTERKNGELQLWDPSKLAFFDSFTHSYFADSFSLYTLELFPGSRRYHQQHGWLSHSHHNHLVQHYGSEDHVYHEFSLLKDRLLDAWYRRYELSNFALAGKSSIHNRIYREMDSYLWVGTSAASFLHHWHPCFDFVVSHLKQSLSLTTDLKALRWTNTKVITQYCAGQFLDDNAISLLYDKDLLIESFFLWLRTDRGIPSLHPYEAVLAENYQSLIQEYVAQWLMVYVDNRIVLTDTGMDVYNTLVTNLLREV